MKQYQDTTVPEHVKRLCKLTGKTTQELSIVFSKSTWSMICNNVITDNTVKWLNVIVMVNSVEKIKSHKDDLNFILNKPVKDYNLLVFLGSFSFTYGVIKLLNPNLNDSEEDVIRDIGNLELKLGIEQTKVKFTWTIRKLKNYHNSLVYKINKTKLETFSTKAHVKTYKINIPGAVQLPTPRQIAARGIEHHHCLMSYANNTGVLIFKILTDDGDTTLMLHANSYKIEQHRGSHNSDPCAEHIKIAQQLCTELKKEAFLSGHNTTNQEDLL